MKKIVVIGEILVEVMADTSGEGFDGPQPLTGPFPSGAPAIFADQAAHLGQPVGIVSAVGDDDFGHLNLVRLAQDGVDISAVYIDQDRPTGSAFVRYRDDGSRKFVFNIAHSACGRVHDGQAVDAMLGSADHVHVMGSSLSSPDMIELNLSAASALRSRGGTVSFDPNLRPEILSAPGMAEALSRVIRMTDLFLPSGPELTLLTEAKDKDAAVAELLDLGVTTIVHKNGAAGATCHDLSGSHHAPAFEVDEVDPTGAGDCFGATFTSLWLRGVASQEALIFACASGALAVTRRGPMEGTSDLPTLERFVATHMKAKQ